MRPSTHQRGGIYVLSEDTEMKAKLSTFTRRLEELKMRNQHEVQAVIELPTSHPSCFNCQSSSHLGEHCPMVPSVRDLMLEHAHVLGQNKPPTNAPYGNTYNPNWRNHPNLSWKPKPPAYAPQGAQQQFSSTSAQQQQPPPSSPVEQAILNLSKVVGTFVEEQGQLIGQNPSLTPPPPPPSLFKPPCYPFNLKSQFPIGSPPLLLLPSHGEDPRRTHLPAYGAPLLFSPYRQLQCRACRRNPTSSFCPRRRHCCSSHFGCRRSRVCPCCRSEQYCYELKEIPLVLLILPPIPLVLLPLP